MVAVGVVVAASFVQVFHPGLATTETVGNSLALDELHCFGSSANARQLVSSLHSFAASVTHAASDAFPAVVL